MPLPFVLLILSICATWLPALHIGSRYRVHPWAVLYGLALVTAFAQGFVHPSAVAALLVLVALALWMLRLPRGAMYWLAFSLLLLLSLALALHRIPGFNNPIVIDGVQFSPDARPSTQHLNFDKGSVGLVLLALLAPKLRRGDDARRLAIETAAAWALTAAVGLGVAAAVGLIHFDLKAPKQAALFLVVNLFFTCVAEEAFFRVMVQDPLRGARPGRPPMEAASSRVRAVAAILVSGLLFGLVHAAGGATLVVMAALAGIGYAAVYGRTSRIEAPIFVHFGLNAILFLAFTVLRG